jgi:hypothetical protein
MECWLKPNRRVLVVATLLPLLIAAISLAVAVAGANPYIRAACWIVAGLAILLSAAIAWQAALPRIGYQGGSVLFFLRTGGPVRVPLDVVEAFLMGQAPSLLPGEKHRDEQTSTVVVRLAERAPEWSHVEVKPSLASWCDGYITIRGTWCEPLDVDVVKRLNRVLSETRRREENQPA